MDRQEFIDRLRAALNNAMAPALVMDHVKYYEDYIQVEIRKGKSEQEVLASLGDPRLIARTIIQTNTTDDEASYQSGGYRENTYQDNGYGTGGYQQTRTRDNGDVVRQAQIPGWVWGLVVILVIVLILGIIMSVLSFLAPILIPVVVVLFLVKLFRDWLN